LKKQDPDSRDYKRQLNFLLKTGILTPNTSFPKSTVFNILGKDTSSAEEIACIVDPFAYISHLSAMEWHGLTDRISKTVFLSSLPQVQWTQFALERMKKDCGGDQSYSFYSRNLPRLKRIRLNKIGRKNIHRYSNIHRGAFKSVKDKTLRVSTIGRTFLDMIRRADFCGGIHHVIDIYQEYAKQYQQLIIDEINRHGKQIDKVRAGYILDKLCGLQSDSLEAWVQFVQRGGSRKLDPFEEYSSTYSERWCLSLNI
jgi:predicted transcriptional regulator of viral defense system